MSTLSSRRKETAKAVTNGQDERPVKSISIRRSRPLGSLPIFACVLAFICIFSMEQSRPESGVSHQQSSSDNSAIVSTKEPPARIQGWREDYKLACTKHGADFNQLKPLIDSPLFDVSSRIDDNELSTSVETCPHVFLDLGSNVGDTVGNVISGGLPICGALPANRNIKTMYKPMDQSKSIALQYNVTTGVISANPIWNSLSLWLHDRFQNLTVRPEDLCVFGVEGNPLFTARLKGIEKTVMQHSHPRPVQRLHYFTESVVTDKPGPTKLYLDTIGTDSNFDGSSLYSDNMRIRQTKRRTHGVTAANVMGYSLSQLLKMTVRPGGGHVLVKMDIEGAEYAVLGEASEALCTLAKDTYVAIVVETHGSKADGVEEEYNTKTVPKLRSCGVDVTHGDGG